MLPLAPEISKVPFEIVTAEEFAIEPAPINPNVATPETFVAPVNVFAPVKETEPLLKLIEPDPEITPLMV